MKKLSILIIMALAVGGCAGKGTAFDEHAKSEVGTVEFEQFCADRANASVIVNTGGYLADLFIPQSIQAVGALARGGDDLLDNPTTTALNAKCEEQAEKE